MSDERLSVAILAGGRGSRLGGVDKASLEVGGQTLLDRVLAAVQPLADEVLAIVNDERLRGDPRLTLVHDPEPHAGVLPALLAALETARSPLLLLVACDMPFVDQRVIQLLLDAVADHDVAIPIVGGIAQPMLAVYRVAPCRRAIAAALARGGRRMISFLEDVRTHRVTEDELRAIDTSLRSFFNVNTPAELEEARRLAEQLSG